MNILENYLNKIQEDVNWFVSKSNIHGNGVFANRDINPNEIIDLVFSEKSKKQLESEGYTTKGKKLNRTKFGSLINHCTKRSNSELIKEGKHYLLKATKKIKEGKEITCNYNEGLAYEISGGFKLEKNNCE